MKTLKSFDNNGIFHELVEDRQLFYQRLQKSALPGGIQSMYKIDDVVRRQSVQPSKEYIENSIGRDTLFRWTYIPFVVAEIMWDYLDTCDNISSQARYQEVKKYSRLIRELKKDYDYERKPFIEGVQHEQETEHCYGLQEDMKESFSSIYRDILAKIDTENTDLSKKMYIGASVIAYVVYRAVNRYSYDFVNLIKEKHGINTKSVMPKSFFSLRDVLDKLCRVYISVSETDLKKWTDEIYELMNDIVLFDSDDKPLEKTI